MRDQQNMAQHLLRREMGLLSATVLVIANMVGTGIFTTSGFIMEWLRDPQAMLLCWFLGGIIALSGALCYGELGAMFPRAGGEYVFLRESFGKLMAFLSGWISLIVGFSAPIAAASIAFATYFFRSLSLVPKASVPFLQGKILSLSPVTALAVAIIIVFSLVHWYSLRFGSRVQNLLTGFKILVILAFVAGGVGCGNGSVANFSSGPDLGLVLSGGFATSLIFVSFAYSGWNAAAYLGGEIKNPARNIPLSLFWGTLVVMILYLLLNTVFIYALPVEEISGVIEVGAKAALSLFGPHVGAVVSVAVTVCLLSVISAMIMAGPRIYYAMAKDGVFFRLFSRVNKTHRTPGPAIFLQGAIAVAMVLTSSFDKLLLYIGFTLAAFAMLTVVGMMVLRARAPHRVRPYRTFGYPLTALVFVVSNLWIIVFSLGSNPVVGLYGAATIALGLVVYFCFQRLHSSKQSLSRNPSAPH
ncbi:MAG: APC family permease [Syntrophobacteria bacterium]